MQPNNYITTYRKHRFSPFSPTIDDIDILDIAHALSYMCRANGHFDRFYSIAQHSLNCVREAEGLGLGKKIALQLLLHDASEAYISDITRPVKRELPEYREVEKRLQLTIYARYGLFPNEQAREQESLIDNAMLDAEFFVMAGEYVFEEKNRVKLCSVPDFTERDFKEVEEEFIKTFIQLK